MSHTELITAFQEEVARAYFDLPESEGFLPAGGAALIALGAVERVTDEFVRLSVTGAGDRIEVDLGIDASLLLPPTVTFLRPTIGLEESAGRKTLALFGRAAPGTSSMCSTSREDSGNRICLSWRLSGT